MNANEVPSERSIQQSDVRPTDVILNERRNRYTQSTPNAFRRLFHERRRLSKYQMRQERNSHEKVRILREFLQFVHDNDEHLLWRQRRPRDADRPYVEKSKQ